MIKINFYFILILNLNYFNIILGSYALDVTFNKTGMVVTDVDNQNMSAGTSLVIQNNGKIVIAGQAAGIDGVLHFALARYNEDGSIDTTFNDSGPQPGTVILSQLDGPRFSLVFDMVLQADQKLVLGGQVNRTLGTSDDNNFALARFNTDGSVDTTFGINGTVNTNISGGLSDDAINGLVIQNDQKIVAAGGVELIAHISNSRTAMARYNTDGSLDATFNGTGIQLIDLSGTGAFNRANEITIQPDQKTVITGISGDNYLLARFNIDGSLDTTFNASGALPGVITDIYETGNFTNKGNGVEIQPDGKIIMAGKLVNKITGTAKVGLARYNSNGSLDNSFGDNGKAVFDINFFTVNATLQPDGKIILVGEFDSQDFSQRNFALLRVNANGTLDNSFGNNGLFIVKDFLGFNISSGAEVKTDSKNRIVAAGEVDFANGINSDFAGLRLAPCVMLTDALTRAIRAKY